MLGIKPEMILARPGVRLATKASARRCLFGPVDHDEIKRTIRKEMVSLDMENCQKYNFDFSLEKPMDGRFSWTPVKESEFVPIAYKMHDFNNLSVLAGYTKFLNLGSLCDQEAVKPKQSTPVKPTRRILKPRLRRPMTDVSQNAEELVQKASTSTPSETVRMTLKRKDQSQITDFFPQRKLARKEGKPSSN